MTIQLSLAQLLAILVPQLMSIVGFIIWVKVEIARIKEWREGFELRFSEEKEIINKNAETLMGHMGEIKRAQDDVKNQLFDLNTKVTRSSTIIEMLEKQNKF